MATQKQIEANKRNAAQSSGPKTSKGKAVSSRNAMKTGLLSRELILPGENREEFDALLDQLVQEHKPLGVVETSLLERVAIAMWRQRRLVRAERARIWTQQQGGDAAGANKRSRYETVSDAELDALVLSSEPYVSQLDRLEQELKLLHLAIDLDFAEFAKRYPLLSHLFPAPDPGLFDRYPTFGSTYAGTAAEIDKLRNQWLKGIAYRRKSASIVDVRQDSQSIPESAEILARYQAALDNEWYKALRAFREAQTYRLRTLVPVKD